MPVNIPVFVLITECLDSRAFDYHLMLAVQSLWRLP